MAGKNEGGTLRTIAIVGQSGAGKTQVGEAMLYVAGVTERLGRTDDGSSVFNFEPEELARGATLNAAFHHLSWLKNEIIVADTPGYGPFLADTMAAMRAVDGLVFVADGTGEVKAEAERLWSAATRMELPRLVFVSRLDRENGDYEKALAEFEKALEVRAVPIAIPIVREGRIAGVVDLVGRRALVEREGSRTPVEEELSGELAQAAAAARTRMCDAVAETDDSLLERYLEQGDIEDAELRRAIRAAVMARRLFPALCGAALDSAVGIAALLNAIVEFLPAPTERPMVTGTAPDSNQQVVRRPDPEEPFTALVFKTVADPFVGRLSVMRVFAGRLQGDAQMLNANRQTRERLSHPLRLEGKGHSPIGNPGPGDIFAVAKLKDTYTGDTLCDEKAPIVLPPIERPNPVLSYALRPKSRNDEEKASAALHRLVEEDLALSVHQDPQTHELILSGSGQMHIEVAVEKLKRKFNVEVELAAPKVPYKETIKGRAEAQGKYKRQSGGRGQYGDCWLRIEPLPRGAGFEFVDQIVGGVIPRQYIPSVEKGVRNTMAEGFLAGYPVVDMKVTVFDGSHHPVDSSDMAFQIAASMGLKAAMAKAKPVLLEPIMNLEVTCPEECVGDVIGDLNARRGKVMGVEARGHNQVIRAAVPMAEILRYAPDLRSLTSGRGSFEATFSHYDEVPPQIAEKIIKQAQEQRASEAHA